MKIIFVSFLVLVLLYFSISTTIAAIPYVYHFNFDPTLVEDNTRLRDHPDIIYAQWFLMIVNNKIERLSSSWRDSYIKFDIVETSNFLELIIDIENDVWLNPDRKFRFYYVDAFNISHFVTDISPPHFADEPAKAYFQLKFENGQWFSRYRIDPQIPVWTNWVSEEITDKNNINRININFRSWRMKINDIKVISIPDWAPPPFDLFMHPYDEAGTTIIKTPNYELDSILHTDFAVRSEICPIIEACLMPFNKMIDEIRLIMFDRKSWQIRYLIKYPRDLPYKIYLEPPAPNVPEYVHMTATIRNFRPSTWSLLGYKVFWEDGFAWYFLGWDNHTFIITEEHLAIPAPPPEEPTMPDIIPPILFPDLPPEEPEPIELLERLIWQIKRFFRTTFFPSPDAINNLNYEILRLQHRFPINYINETRRFFENITYTPTNPHPAALTMAFPITGQEAVEIEVLNFNWINNPIYIFGISTTISALLKNLTSLFVITLFIGFTIAIIKIIL